MFRTGDSVRRKLEFQKEPFWSNLFMGYKPERALEEASKIYIVDSYSDLGLKLFGIKKKLLNQVNLRLSTPNQFH